MGPAGLADGALFLAPMEGVTHPAYRDLMAAKGDIDVVCTEFVRITMTRQKERALRRAAQPSEGALLSVQVMGKHEHQMQQAARVMDEAGADFVDINLGCPSPNAVKGGVGSAMLKDPDLVYRVIKEMRGAVRGVLTAKMRAGFDTTGEHLSHVRALTDALVAGGTDLITIHPRRRVDGYSGTADWRIIRAMAEALDVVVVGNGDCWYAADALRMQEETGCFGVMLGRGALRNPFIFNQIAQLRRGEKPYAPTGADVVAHVLELRDAFAGFYGRGAPIGKLKEHLRFLMRALPDRKAARTELLTPRTLDGVLSAVERVFGHLRANELDLDAHGTLGFEGSGGCAIENPVGPPPRTFVGTDD